MVRRIELVDRGKVRLRPRESRFHGACDGFQVLLRHRPRSISRPGRAYRTDGRALSAGYRRSARHLRPSGRHHRAPSSPVLARKRAVLAGSGATALRRQRRRERSEHRPQELPLLAQPLVLLRGIPALAAQPGALLGELAMGVLELMSQLLDVVGLSRVFAGLVGLRCVQVGGGEGHIALWAPSRASGGPESSPEVVPRSRRSRTPGPSERAATRWSAKRSGRRVGTWPTDEGRSCQCVPRPRAPWHEARSGWDQAW